MIAAIYARKSTDAGGVAEDAKSVTRQVENARALPRKGLDRRRRARLHRRRHQRRRVQAATRLHAHDGHAAAQPPFQRAHRQRAEVHRPRDVRDRLRRSSNWRRPASRSSNTCTAVADAEELAWTKSCRLVQGGRRRSAPRADERTRPRGARPARRRRVTSSAGACSAIATSARLQRRRPARHVRSSRTSSASSTEPRLRSCGASSRSTTQAKG